MDADQHKRLSFLDRYLTLWILPAMSPAPAIDEKLQVMGRVPDEHEISALLKAERIDDSRAGTA